jgi:dipeptidyl aminopeptidase/acylaminoacyl peptidase
LYRLGSKFAPRTKNGVDLVTFTSGLSSSEAFMFRTRFKKEIVAEFTPPARATKKQRVIILCDGMPSMPRKQPLMEWLAGKGYWVFYPRYRGAWESDGNFLEKSPHEDLTDVIDRLPGGFKDAAFRERFVVEPEELFVIGGSFGGAAAILSSLDPRVKKVVANCPVVDWAILRDSEKIETSNPSYAEYIREAFGNGYRLADKNWKKLYSGRFYNPAHHLKEINPSKILMFHAKDDPHVPYASVRGFADKTGVRLHSLRRGGHIRTEWVVRHFWPEIKKFFDAPIMS